MNNLLSLQNIDDIYNKPLLLLIAEAAQVHSIHQKHTVIYRNTLVSYKTGGCVEDCAYCAQSSRYKTNIGPSIRLSEVEMMQLVNEAIAQGSDRICLSASWKNIPNNEEFDLLIKVGKAIRNMGLQVCATLGTINREQIIRLREAGFTAYNHNIDTSEEFYPQIISTRTFAQRIETLKLLQEESMACCSGGIVGLGESHADRVAMLHSLASLPQPLFTVPINMLVAIEGTPLENNKAVPVWDLLRVIATARIVMPSTRICLAAGRKQLSAEAQSLCFLAGANSVFVGDKLLTTPNAAPNNDFSLFKTLGIELND
jgi:biotin synthase